MCELGLRGYVSVPILQTDGTVFGTLCGADLGVRQASPDEVAWLRILASLVGFQIERDRLETRLSHLALHDPLTSLPNRAHLMDRLARINVQAPRPGGDAALLFLDLDNFKRVNDTLGHEAGDDLLKAVADRLRSCVRGGDLVARLGGDEFVVLLDRISSHELAVQLAERILAALSRPYRLGDHDVVATPSIGIALSDQVSAQGDVETLMRAADQAMYRAKSAGKGTYAVYDPEIAADG